MSSSRHKQAVQAQFGATAESYVTSPTHARSPDLQRMVSLASLHGDAIVLDVATGGGHTALAFAPHVREVIATDLTPTMLAAAQRFITSQGVANVRFKVADAEALPFPAAHFDAVTCRIAPHHFSDIEQFVGEVARVLKAGGRFVLVDTIAPDDPTLDTFLNQIEQLRDPTHVRNYTIREWQATCAGAGLQVEHVESDKRAAPFDPWVERARAAAEARAELNRRLVDATPEAYAEFAIEVVDGRVTQFAMRKLLLLARKP